VSVNAILPPPPPINAKISTGYVIIRFGKSRKHFLLINNSSAMDANRFHSGGSILLSSGNSSLDSGNVLLNSGNGSLNSGKVLLDSGNGSLNSGKVLLNSGNGLLDSGKVLLNSVNDLLKVLITSKSNKIHKYLSLKPQEYE
jgi:hypothetical protein